MIKVIKIGGNVVDNPVLLSEFVKDFAAMPGMKVLVHGVKRAFAFILYA